MVIQLTDPSEYLTYGSLHTHTHTLSYFSTYIDMSMIPEIFCINAFWYLIVFYLLISSSCCSFQWLVSLSLNYIFHIRFCLSVFICLTICLSFMCLSVYLLIFLYTGDWIYVTRKISCSSFIFFQMMAVVPPNRTVELVMTQAGEEVKGAGEKPTEIGVQNGVTRLQHHGLLQLRGHESTQEEPTKRLQVFLNKL